MPYYSTNSRKTSSKSSKSPRRTHSRECVAEKVQSKSSRSKESIREVTLKLMALMKQKRECDTTSR
jgi:hypothetical protein